MKTKIGIFAFFLILLYSTIFTTKIRAQEKASGSSATLQTTSSERGIDNRATQLKKFLSQYDSPLAPYADVFVAESDANNIDWKLLAAISGVESTFGKAVPCTNAWGYNIYGDHMLCFSSYKEGIKVISKAIRETYMDKWGDQDVWDIGRQYAASPTWAYRVDYFMNEIQDFSLRTENGPIPISL